MIGPASWAQEYAMSYDEKTNQAERYDGRSCNSLRDQMVQLLILRKQVQRAEANRKKRFSIVKGINEANLTSARTMVAIRQRKVAGGR